MNGDQTFGADRFHGGAKVEVRVIYAFGLSPHAMLLRYLGRETIRREFDM